MNALFKIDRPASVAEPERAKPTSVLVSSTTRTYEFILKPKARAPQVSAGLTIEDQRQLLLSNPPITNAQVAVRAKVVYAAGGGIKGIQRQCSISKDFAKKLHAAFGRAAKRQKQVQ